MKGYLVVSWNMYNCSMVYLRVFLCKKECDSFIKGYKLDESIEEEITVEEVLVGN